MSASISATSDSRRPVRVPCSWGGHAPCVDDLCHGSDQTMCGLERGLDFCDHGFYPDSCKDCEPDEGFDE